MTARDETLRLLDATRNRIREALRVIEDHHRFLGDDPSATRTLKELRHTLRAVTERIGEDHLLAARDIAGDVGREISTPAEQTRRDAADVLRAAFARLTEAARSFEEHAKVLDPSAGAAVEQIRYAAYDLEQRVLLRGDLAGRFRAHPLYVILTEALCSRGWEATARAVLDAGVRVVQLREKHLPDRALRQRLDELRRWTADCSALLIVNDRPDLARLCGADGVHVGQDDLPVPDVRRIAGGRPLVGLSTHSPEQFEQGVAAGPDHLAIGPMFPTTTKPQDHVAGPDTLRAVAAGTDLPVVAIGGITPEHVPALREAGASHICVCSAIISATDPGAAAREFLDQF